MKRRKQFKFMAAWVLLVAFIGAVALKDLHFHKYGNAPLSKQKTSKAAVVKAVCYVCDFVFHKSEAAKSIAYHPIISFTISKPVLFTTQLVYRFVESVNSHSPPFQSL